jgi:hypothetical protein
MPGKQKYKEVLIKEKTKTSNKLKSKTSFIFIYCKTCIVLSTIQVLYLVYDIIKIILERNKIIQFPICENPLILYN